MFFNISNLICADENKAVAPWVENSFPVIKAVIVGVIAFLAVVMIVMNLMQKSNTNSSAAITGQSNTFYNRNKGATLQGKLKILTIIDAVLILVLCIAFLVLNTIYAGNI
ncbi:MAG: preprotein translocase subunit SecG [Clostridia bacterium]|nr:preprotein translocase subunit SecG [Clostridia bacterium]